MSSLHQRWTNDGLVATKDSKPRSFVIRRYAADGWHVQLSWNKYKTVAV